MTHAVVTGANGFIGYNLVKRLLEKGNSVTCLVREKSNLALLKSLDVKYSIGDIRDRASVKHAVQEADVVFHAAGITSAVYTKEFLEVNEQGTDCIAACCAEQNSPPTLVYVSSLAAVGPGVHGPECRRPAPVSHYGRSKLAGELAISKYAAVVPSTIVRPPMVLGSADRVGLPMFQTIANWGLHFVPSLSEFYVSVIHSDDLVNALILAANRGQRMEPSIDGTTGIYFVTADETPSYADLGQIIGSSIGRREVRIVRAPKGSVWFVAAINELMAHCLRKPVYLNLDKAREATAGSWTCASTALSRDTGFTPARSLAQRLSQTVEWYIDNGWMKIPRTHDRHVDADSMRTFQ